jgi:two-component system, chemotaxis family, response regulator Rcp1
MSNEHRPVKILLVEDNPGDVRLTVEALRDSKILNDLEIVPDGVEALRYLRREPGYRDAARPDLVLLDLNLPRKDGREVLAELNKDDDLRRVPVVVMTTSRSEEDVLRSYDFGANCYITKPLDMNQFVNVVQAINDFWFTIVTLPEP